MNKAPKEAWEEGIQNLGPRGAILLRFVDFLANETRFVVDYNDKGHCSCNVSLVVYGRQLSLFQFKHDGTGQMPEPGGEFDGHADVSEDDVRQIRVARKRCRRNMIIQPSRTPSSGFSPSKVNSGSDKDLAEHCCHEYAEELADIDAEWQAKQG